MTQTHSTLGSSSTENRPQRQRPRRGAIPAGRIDAVTGLISGDAFLNEADALLVQATRTAREVAFVSLLVEDMEQPDSCDSDALHDQALAAIGASLLDVRAQRDVVGRVGAAEFNWMCVLGRGSELAGAVERLQTAVDANLDGVDTEYRVGFTLAHGRRIDVDALIVEAREHRDAQPRSVAPP